MARRGWGGWESGGPGWFGLLLAAGLWACPQGGGSSDGMLLHSGPDGGGAPITGGDGTDGGGDDGGDGGDGGSPGDTDGGAGTDGGTKTDAGSVPAMDGGTVVLPSTQGWQFFGPQHGGPRTVYGVSSDRGGNVWVAGGDDGLFLLEPGAASFRRFTHSHGLSGYTDSNGVRGYKVLSVAGGPAGTVYVGYEGLFAGMEDNDPPYMVTSGDADRVVWSGGNVLSITHLDLSTGPGVDPHYPLGRDKLRTVFRILYDAQTGDVWFGGNHGVALWQKKTGEVFEHQHVAINGFTAQGVYTLLSGDWAGIGLDAAGDLWMGGGHRVGRLRYGSEGQNFWATVSPILDVWPDAKESDATSQERTDDFIQDLAVAPNGEVWVGSIPNGLARLTSSGPAYVRGGLLDPKVTALETDPEDGSLWVGHLWGGLTRRLPDGTSVHYDYRILGLDLVSGQVPDIQSDRVGGQRRILVAFESGAIGVYTGK